MSAIDFKSEVLDKSMEIPVLVDFWAPWCGPCKILGPVIEQLAEEQKDKWKLVKINTEEMPDVAEEYKIRSIPNVKLFHQGEVIGEFVGALPKHSIENWLESYLPNEQKTLLEDILTRIGGETHEQAMSELDQFVTANPSFTLAKVALANQLIFANPEKAIQLVSSIKMGQKFFEAAEDIRTLSALMMFEKNGHAAGDALSKAKQAIIEQDYEKAIQQIIEATTLDKNYANDLPRRSGIALFRMWGANHELSKQYRWKFDMAMY
jgi:putative thioredoxin